MSTEKFSRWRKSTSSDSGHECVEVGTSGRTIGVRDTKQYGQGPVLELDAGSWRRFVGRVKAGEHDMRG